MKRDREVARHYRSRTTPSRSRRNSNVPARGDKRVGELGAHAPVIRRRSTAIPEIHKLACCAGRLSRDGLAHLRLGRLLRAGSDRRHRIGLSGGRALPAGRCGGAGRSGNSVNAAGAASRPGRVLGTCRVTDSQSVERGVEAVSRTTPKGGSDRARQWTQLRVAERSRVGRPPTVVVIHRETAPGRLSRQPRLRGPPAPSVAGSAPIHGGCCTKGLCPGP
jgi:hypothetical protein